jgi:Flp pilus assembly protein TadD
MNRFRLLAAIFLVGFCGVARVVAGPEEDYLTVYQLLEEADTLEANNSVTQARQRFSEIQARLTKIKEAYPNWNQRTVDFRLDYVNEKLKKLGGPVQQPQAQPSKAGQGVAQPMMKPAAPVDPTAELRATIAQLQEERRVLQAKLQEALAAQPAAVDPKELQKAEAQITALQKEKELLRVALEQEKANVAKADTKSGLEEAQKEIANLRSQLAASSAPVTAMERELQAARDSARTNALAVTALQQALKDVKGERDAVLARASAADRAILEKPASGKSSGKLSEKDAQRMAILQARLEVLEARAVPYTAEELALFKQPALAGKAPPAKGESKKKELPAGAGLILTEAQRAFAKKDYKTAEEQYLKVLAMDDKNIFTLGNLGAIQMEMGRLADAEATLTKANAIDSTDGFVLSMLGILRFRQNKFDDALSLLSRAVELDPRNFEAYNYLGITLGQKGQRQAAETALRKSLELAPNYAEAHHNLAVVYATQQPPFMELAKYHYNKATSLGFPKNEEFEKMVSKK